MKISQFNPKIISITDLRRDVDILEKVLAQEKEAWVLRNQNLLFVAIAPEKYQELKKSEEDNKGMEAAIATIDNIREKFGKAKKRKVSDYVSEMRDEAVKRWKR